MNWMTILWIAGGAFLVLVLMRSCGGMMGRGRMAGGCGMGRTREPRGHGAEEEIPREGARSDTEVRPGPRA